MHGARSRSAGTRPRRTLRPVAGDMHVIYRFNDCELDTRSYRLSVGGEPVAIEPQVFELLSYLIEHREKLVSRTELFDAIWSGRIVSDTTLSNHVKSARKAIGDDGRAQRCIKTVHGRGYQFIADTQAIVNHASDLSRLAPGPSAGGEAGNHGPFVAVLPFQNMSSDPEQNFFAEGMSEDITTELSRFSDIQVIARHSAFQYRGPSLDIAAVSRELGVQYLIEGSVRRTPDTLRVNVQLIDAHRGAHLWAEKFDRPLEQVFQVQDEITATIVSTVTGEIRQVETDRARSRVTGSLRAYDHLLRGLSYHKNGHVSYDNSLRAAREFEQAIALDPVFARARAWIVCSRASAWAAKSTAVINAAIADARYALSLDKKESETHRILGALYLYARNYELSGHHLTLARQLSPNDAHIAVKSGRYCAYIDEFDEALATMQRAMRLNPRHPGWYWQELGIVHYSMGEYRNAIATFYKNWELGDFDLAWIAASHVALGEHREAEAAARKALELEPRAAVGAYTRHETYRDAAKHELLCNRMARAGLPS